MDITPETNNNDTLTESDELNVVNVNFGEYKKVRRRSHHSSGDGSHKKSSSHSSHKRKKRGKILKRILITVGCVLLSLVLIAAGTFLYLRGTGKQQLTATSYTISAPNDAYVRNDGYTVEYNGKTYEYNKELVNLLFMGIDDHISEEEKKEYGSNNQADVIIVASLDLKNKKAVFVNVPRDIITDVVVYSKTGGYTGIEKLPIAMSYAYGDGKTSSCINTLDSVRKMFYNIPISSYVSLDVNGIGDINDCIGGVDVTSPEDVYMGSTLLFKTGESYHLVGDEARDFVMYRNMEIAEANLLRNQRQSIYLSSFLNKAVDMTKSDLSTPITIYNTAEPYTCTNMNINKTTYLISELLSNSNPVIEMKTLPVDVKQVEDHAENYLREKEFYELFLSVFYNEVK